MARPGSAAWFRAQREALQSEAAAGVRWGNYIAAGGDASGVPPDHPVWQHPIEGNAAVLDMEGGTEPRAIFPDLESALNYISDNAALDASDAWLIEETDEGALLYIADDTQKRGRGR